MYTELNIREIIGIEGVSATKGNGDEQGEIEEIITHTKLDICKETGSLECGGLCIFLYIVNMNMEWVMTARKMTYSLKMGEFMTPKIVQ